MGQRSTSEQDPQHESTATSFVAVGFSVDSALALGVRKPYVLFFQIFLLPGQIHVRSQPPVPHCARNTFILVNLDWEATSLVPFASQ